MESRTPGRRDHWTPDGPLVWGMALLLVLATMSFAPADRVHLTNNSVIEGKVVYEDGAEVHVERGGSLIVITKDRVALVERTEDHEVGPGEEHATTARRRLEVGEAAAAWQALLDMHAAEPESATRNESLIVRVWTQVLENTNALLRSNSLAAARERVDLLAREESTRLMEASRSRNAETLLDRLRVLRGNVYWQIGREHRREQQRAEALEALREAVQLLRPSDANYAPAEFELARLLRDVGNRLYQQRSYAEADRALREALEHYQKAQSSAMRDAVMVQLALREGFEITQSLGAIERARMPTPTPAPTPMPFILPTPAPTPTPVPGVFEKMFGAAARERAMGVIDRVLPEDIDRGKAADWAAYALVFVFAFWFIPWLIFKILVRRADFLADQWRGRVMYLGPIALLGYLVSYFRLPSAVRHPKQTMKPCPHCGFNLDNILAYESLDFAHCPNCGGEIAALFTLDEYIEFVATGLATDAEKVAMGMVSMASFVEKDLMQKLIAGITTKAVRQRASDIHVEPQQDHVAVRYRVDGMMMDMVRLASSLGPAVVSAIKVKADMDISEKRRPQDGSMQITVDEATIDIRVASSPSQTGETISLRLLDFRSIQVDAKRLGMTKSTREVFERAIREPHGLIIVCGPTGSGKTTTLYVALRSIATGDKNIISIEDPIEFRLPRVNQIQVNPAAGLTFATGLRSILRQDPDVLMIGEVRDHETAEIAVNAAQTGHLVFTSLHTIDAASAVTRLWDLGTSPRQFSHALTLIIAQRLIRLVCPHCAKDYTPKDALLNEIGIPLAEQVKFEFLSGAGCDACNQTGYMGRTGLFEMLAPNSQIKSAMEKGTLSTPEMRDLAISAGMRTLREESILLLRNRMTTPEEVLRVTK